MSALGASPSRRDLPRFAVVWRGVAFFLLWVVLMQTAKVGDLAVGAFAAATATWVSLRLLPPACGGVHFGHLLLLLPHFVWESVRAGVDVARRALAPRWTFRPVWPATPSPPSPA
jgi:multicomponent Na+:H+ antiporter subunit E